MTVLSQPGYFWCDQCQDQFPDTIKQDHIERHGNEPITPDDEIVRGFGVGIFFAFCLTAGAFGGLIVSNFI